ncbi:4a-hydroxytetrahydrobiopterin dehydratase [Sedimenticola selenatireducens]|uniref:Putative pterin-4-alpha-carbinolamine dehydratase n=1 Tax=Sedimenticola selenatireducens TaxID=191960 RepID=A0A558DJN5_9GAMM|nr:4a-hydroxytetrahydrobiopterin dehydratase [Sedimenticola selenatireducens]TVO68860.1 4a-hydroxytetrahydrobiopterin dehydratase [Sedimenticola selenatireducens]TVT61232.1 MAG: 4a-hydroxytetrahydrobiopterin dehydratase [Sedimenticola selenatireducens]
MTQRIQSTTALNERQCLACTTATAMLTATQCKAFLVQLNADWVLASSAKEISRTFKFKDYYQTMAFVNAVAWIANRQDHHPELIVNYNRCQVRYSTHTIGGLSENDFICAAKIDALE